jgi:hypothetical protein
MKKLLALIPLLLALLGFASDASAQTTRNYCKCDTGAQGGCVATSPTFPAEATVENAVAGDQFLFCEGGFWQQAGSFSGLISVTACRPLCTSRIVFGKYTAGWGGGGVKPKFRCTGASCFVFRFGSFAETTLDGGYTVQDLDLGGNDTGGSGVFIDGNIQYITVQRVDFSKFAEVAVDLQESPPADTSKRIYFIEVLDSTFTDSGGLACIGGSAEDLLVSGNTFYRCGGCPGTCHTLYLGGEGKRMVLVGNTMSAAGGYGTGNQVCRSGNISIRGKHDQIRVENNTIDNSAAEPTSTCGGIQIKPAYCFECSGDTTNAAIWDIEYLRRTIVRGNTVIDTYITPIEVGAARYVVVENNVVVRTRAHSNPSFEYPSAAVQTNPPRTYADETDIGGTFRNNTCFMAAAGDGATCFNFDGAAGHGTGVTVANNVAYASGPFTGTQSCFRHGALSSYTAWNNNTCYGMDRWSSTASSGGGYADHAAAHAAGFDTWSAAGGLADNDPLLTTPTSGNSWDASISSDSSPAHNNGSNTYKARFDKLGCLRDSTPSIGAFERGGTPCTTTTRSPQWVR